MIDQGRYDVEEFIKEYFIQKICAKSISSVDLSYQSLAYQLCAVGLADVMPISEAERIFLIQTIDQFMEALLDYALDISKECLQSRDVLSAFKRAFKTWKQELFELRRAEQNPNGNGSNKEESKMSGVWRYIEEDEIAIVFKVCVKGGEAKLIAELFDYDGRKTTLKIHADEEVMRQIECLAKEAVEAYGGSLDFNGRYPLNEELQSYLLNCLAKRELKFTPSRKAD